MNYTRKRVKLQAVLLSCLVISLSFSVSATHTFTDYDLTYDGVGNLQQAFNQYLEYNEFNQLVRVRETNASGNVLVEYLYDQDGNRMWKENLNTSERTYYVNDNYIETVNSTGAFVTVYYQEDGMLVGRKDDGGKKYFYHPDHLEGTHIVTNETGSVVEETTYRPFGEVIDDGTSRFLFTGKELDDEVSMYYYGARYYDPFFRHFTQPDENILDVYNPQDLNRYAYVRNNPYKFVDPEGEIPQLAATIALAFSTSFLIGVTLEFRAQRKQGSDFSTAFQAAFTEGIQSGVESAVIATVIVGGAAVVGLGITETAISGILLNPAISQSVKDQRRSQLNQKDTSVSSQIISQDTNINLGSGGINRESTVSKSLIQQDGIDVGNLEKVLEKKKKFKLLKRKSNRKGNINAPIGDPLILDRLVEQAAKGDVRALRQLQSLQPYPFATFQPIDLEAASKRIITSGTAFPRDKN